MMEQSATNLELETAMIEVLTELNEDAKKMFAEAAPFIAVSASASANPLRPQRRRVPQIPVKMIDLHTTVCSDCENRRLHMKQVYQLRIDPDKHTNEYLARDIIFEHLLEECRECYVKSIKELE